MPIAKTSAENPADPVLIVGAGPTGLVLAIELARRGVPFHLIDKRPAPLLWDRASVIKSRSLEIFEALGVSAEFLRQGKKILGTDFYGGGSRRASFRFGALDTPFPFMLGLPESVTERLLTDALERLGGAVDRGVELVDLQANEAGVRVRVNDGGNERLLAASWVVGADGLHSRIRDLIGVDFPGHDYPLHWGVVDVRLAGWPHADGVAAVSFDPPVIPIPMGEDRWRINFRCDPADPTQIAHLEQWIRQFAPGATIMESDPPQLFHTHCRMAPRFRVERVLLAGDAAHACSPIEGHGMNGGIQDGCHTGACGEAHLTAVGGRRSFGVAVRTDQI
jgi:2-polyprenyl-6-methoxyphenol hydroxylase-like FAD-dependent oxidoreductase